MQGLSTRSCNHSVQMIQLHAWFGAAEAQFHLHWVFTEADRFCLVAAALDKESLNKVVHLV